MCSLQALGAWMVLILNTATAESVPWPWSTEHDNAQSSNTHCSLDKACEHIEGLQQYRAVGNTVRAEVRSATL